ncbi:Xaa-Pro aminopeptidase [Nitrosomonas halophila]|uniref:Xaa-Pro aminopeptidase n=1 Tax=Nitrosomonas halophila TaxID=44576 RepID=A0A1H3JAE5_9PROT|nr:Xaa-Pro aminopeptidase [Nitrosomonas halophila]SDY36164.1 Xaa-Pro aminopeptidase [Nitrosomonas halophila]
MIPIQTYMYRRRRLLAQMQRGVAVIPTASEKLRNRDAHYPYRFDSDFYYLTGFREPDAVLVLIAAEDESASRQILFCRDKDPEREIWDGFRHGPQAAQEMFGFDAAHAISTLDALAVEFLADQPAVFHAMGQDPAWDQRIVGWINQVRGQIRKGVAAPTEIRDVRALVDEMRLIKDDYELAVMREAARISCQAHRRAMRAACPGKHEYEIEAELLHEFRRQGAQAPAYAPIVAGGTNACTLHYVDNHSLLQAGDLLLIDAGCEYDGYAADITRTFPVNGRFSGPQKAIYELVLAAQAAAIDAVQPGNSWDAPHQAALRVLIQGFIDLGLCHGSLDAVMESEAYKQFYMHRTGHWLGLDVHDAGEYKQAGQWRHLVPGMTLTVEPGCYIRPAEGVPAHFWDIGVRIEDDVAVTSAGHEILTQAAPKSIAEIEEWMQCTTITEK